MDFECSSAGCGLRVVVGASSKFATSQSQSETNAREVQMLRSLLRSGHSRGPRRLHICVHTCVTHLSAVFIMCNHVCMNASYVIYASRVLIPT